MNNIISSFFLLFILSCDESSDNKIDVYGCTEPSATNYNEYATIDDQSCQYDEDTYFNVNIDVTGESTLFIFQNTIDIQNGDEIGLFDLNGTIDSDGNIGEILVGSGIWNGEQLDVVTIGSVDLSQFDGPILPGYLGGNTMVLKIWNSSSQVETEATYNILTGTGTFNELFTTIDNISN